MQKRPKIFYVPGMITLLLLPILCYFYLRPYIKHERVLEITFAQKYDSTSKYHYFDTAILFKKEFKRKYQTIKLNGNNDKQKLDTFRFLIRNMVQSKDTVFGVHLIFIENAKYGSFVQSINILRQESVYNYAPFENQLWALYIPLDSNRIEKVKKRRIEEAAESKEILKQRNIDKTTFIERIKWVLKVWPIFIILLILAIITIKRK
jgi:hypothetical protein